MERAPGYHYRTESLGACGGGVGGNNGACSGSGEGCVMKTSRSHEWESSANQSPSSRGQESEGTNQIRSSRSHEWDHLHHPSKNPPANLDLNMDQSKLANSFGLIKDISVNNILASDTDKTKDFDKKDFSQMYHKKLPAAMQDMETVFEPRPPYPSNDGGRYLHLTPPPAMTWNQTGVKDIWVEQSKQEHYAPVYCRSPSSRSPRQSMAAPRSPRETRPRSPRDNNSRSPRESLSRSPRESYSRSPRESLCRSPREAQPRSPWEPVRSPRDASSRSPRESYSRSPRDLPRPQPVFTFEPYATAGSVPDLLTSCPARCLAATNPGRTMAPPQQMSSSRHRVVHSCSDVMADVMNPFEDDDPGPRLDAVLRSLQKLSSRLGDNDEFLSSLSVSNPGDSLDTETTTEPTTTTSQHGSHSRHGNHSQSINNPQQQHVHPPDYATSGNHSNHGDQGTRGNGSIAQDGDLQGQGQCHQNLRPSDAASDGMREEDEDENAVFV